MSPLSSELVNIHQSTLGTSQPREEFVRPSMKRYTPTSEPNNSSNSRVLGPGADCHKPPREKKAFLCKISGNTASPVADKRTRLPPIGRNKQLSIPAAANLMPKIGSRLTDFRTPALGMLVALRSGFREWEVACSNYDTKVSNVVLESFLNRDIIYEANLLFKSQARRGAEPSLRTLHEMDLALKNLEGSASKVKAAKNSWFPNAKPLNAFLKYFEEDKDTNASAKLSEIVE
ncbi:hypothetical protein Ancab_000526 [Ancistrocladus abbreviatus]